MISAQFLLTALVVVLAPGTGNVYVLAMGLGRGRRAALAASVGCTLGIVPALLAAMAGLAAVLHTSALLFNALKWAGVLYLLWLAWGALRRTGSMSVRAERGGGSMLRVAWRGIVLNVLNPKLSLFFLALLPPFLSGDPARATAEMAALGGVFMAMTLVVFALQGAFAGAFRTRVLASERAMLWLDRGIAAAFAAMAGRLATERA